MPLFTSPRSLPNSLIWTDGGAPAHHTPSPRFRSSGFWFLSRNIIPDNFIYYFLRDLRPVSLLWRELTWLLQQQHCCCNSYTWMMKWRIFFVRLHCPSLPLSLSESLPLPLYPLPLIPFIQIACYFQMYSSRSFAFVFWEVVLCIKPVFFFWLLYIVHFFLARVCLCIRVSLFFFNVNNYFLEQIFFLGDI